MSDVLFLFGVLISLAAAALWLLLPVVSLIRSSRMSRELAEIKGRLAALEAAFQGGVSPPRPREGQVQQPPVAEPASVAEPAPPAAVPREAPALQVPPPPPPSPPPVMSQPVEPAAAVAADSRAAVAAESTLEEAIGGRLMLWVGAIVLVLGVAFFLKYAFDNEWITESMRVAIGLAIGVALIAAGQRFASAGYHMYGQIVSGGGLASLYLSIYAAFSFYGLIGQAPTFALLVLVTAGAALLADRQSALGLALMAVGGGFLTPFLVGGGQDAQLTLFTYDAILVVGTLYLANRQDWPILNACSYALTVLTIAAWMAEYYRPDKWVRTELFLTLFAVLFLLILRAQLARHGWRSVVTLVLATAPLLYHLTSLAVIGTHGVAMWVYLIAATMVAVGLAVRADSTTWRWAAWVMVVLPLVAWIGTRASSRWLTANLVTAIAVFALHSWAQVDRVFRQQRTLGWADVALQHANGYALLFSLYLAVEDVWLAIASTLCLAVAGGHGALTKALWNPDRRAALNALAVALGALTAALAIELDGPWLTVALAVEGAAIVAIGLHLGERAFRYAGGAVLGVAICRYFALSLSERPAVFSLLAHEAFVMGLVLAALLYALALYARRFEPEGTPLLSWRAGATVLGSVLVVVACSAHNDAYWSLKGDVSADARFASSLALSTIWTVLASAFLGVGLLRAYPPLRYVAMALFGLTVLKVFLVDLSSLGGLYRILGFIGVGLVLLAVSFLYQRGRAKDKPSASP